MLNLPGRAKTVRRDAQPLSHGERGRFDVLANDAVDRFAPHEPGRPCETELSLGRRLGLHVDVIIRVIAEFVSGRNQSFEPRHVGLFQYAAHAKVVNQSSVLFRDPTGLDCVFLRVGVEVPFFKVPLHHPAFRIMAAHLQIERDRDQRLVVKRRGPPSAEPGRCSHRGDDGAREKRSAIDPRGVRVHSSSFGNHREAVAKG